LAEYLTPAVYIEETSFRARSIEGVATSTAGFAGVTRYGPVSYSLSTPPLVPPPAGTTAPKPPSVVVPPPLVTSYGEFERAFGDLADVRGKTNFTAFAARAFFANGGQRLYIARVFPFADEGADGATGAANISANEATFAKRTVQPPTGTGVGATPPPPVAQWRARWPGAAGREIKVSVALRRSKNIIVGGSRLSMVREFALVELLDVDATPKDLNPANLRTVHANDSGGLVLINDDAANPEGLTGKAAYHLQVDVAVSWGSRTDTYTELAIDSRHPRSVLTALSLTDPADSLSLVWLRPAGAVTSTPAAASLLVALLNNPTGYLTEGGADAAVAATEFAGLPVDDEHSDRGPTGLSALGTIDDIAIVAVPDTGRFTGDEAGQVVTDLIGHCEKLRYRVAVVDPPQGLSISGVRAFRTAFDSSYGALYYPWVEIIDPRATPEPGAPPPKLPLPPSGFVAGVYARTDIDRGVHKAPANEIIRSISGFESAVTYGQQGVLNPDGINALRFFPGRGNRIWGARTLSSDPEWKYVNVRRLFVYLEHSIDKATQWAVFEPNNERLWGSIRRAVEDFLFVRWRDGALLGTRPEEAYFVRCDRTTMSQNDLDNGRMICLVGVAPTYPAEFVIFRIGQWTADSPAT
jgi:phage tail sheath protein FI